MTDLHLTLAAAFGPVAAAREVLDTPDLRRIRDAARRKWQEGGDVELLRDVLTAHYQHTPPGQCGYDPAGCEGCKAARLNDAQAVLLREAHNLDSGAVGALRPGKGKTLISLLLPTVLEAKKPLLIVPADLVEKTKRAALQYARHWRIPPITIKSYQWLANPKQLDWLLSFAPDMVIADEAGALKDPSTITCKRVSKYLRAHPACRFIPLSGSIAGRSIGEHWHYVRWALRSRAPVPHSPLEMKTWALAMDEKVAPDLRTKPDALFGLAPEVHDAMPVVRARKAYAARFTQTPGVVCTGEDVPPCGLRVRLTELELPQIAQDAIATMRATWQTPGGEDFTLALDLWRHATTLGCGLYYKWDPAPPQAWRDARRNWYTWARDKLAHARSFDSVVHLVERVDRGEIDDGGLLHAWRAVEKSFTPNSVPVWVHDAALTYSAKWLDKGGGLVWASQAAFGRRLSELTGVPYFKEGGLDATGRLIDEYRGDRAIVSLKSCGKGHNLQHFHRNLLPCPMSKGDVAEQWLARTHREGQEADEVTAELLGTCTESYQSLAQAYKDAFFAEQTLAQPQRLAYADKEGWEPISALLVDPQHTTGA